MAGEGKKTKEPSTTHEWEEKASKKNRKPEGKEKANDNTREEWMEPFLTSKINPKLVMKSIIKAELTTHIHLVPVMWYSISCSEQLTKAPSLHKETTILLK